jgi:uncharacterized protein with HEPN domain
MLGAARSATSYVAGWTLEQFSHDASKQDAVIYRVGIIGEAASHISDETKSLIPLDWPLMTGMRNRLFHGYREVRIPIVWKTVRADLPHMIEVIERYLASDISSPDAS